LAAIGEQFEGSLAEGDDICGLSVSPRDRDDIIQIWNFDAKLAVNDSVLSKVHSLVPEVQFLAEFYKPHQTHAAYEGVKRAGVEQTAHNLNGRSFSFHSLKCFHKFLCRFQPHQGQGVVR